MSQKRLQTVLENACQTGVYHLPESGLAAVREAADALGLACFEVSLADVVRIDAVLAALGRGLDFPEWYGHNFDALKDCLTDFSWQPAAGCVIIVSHAETLQATHPATFQTLNEVFTAAIAEWRSQGLPLWVFYDLRSDGLATLPTVA
ncbi:conserved hypothetical protein [Candidatus Accumulibacter aalborgensis]|uniref:Barstar (barnase inhibitor) domain-containing protein n=1 Tax=Candidatus Accumulibacter aalborgensis TaxID=1860102 RepID=A0A1A8XPH8_9PROT|nr:barstar family protein [Candidatus Accumulibacter aalborgensis]SBT07079.1 conserved hypothetical protein [Candidatus Accumulibacter aalborgensis]